MIRSFLMILTLTNFVFSSQLIVVAEVFTETW